MQTVYDFSFETVEKEKNQKAETLQLSNLKNKVIMIVNIATKCGFTGQLEDLENLNKQFKDKDFILIGVPSNDFGGQTPENDKDVLKFCHAQYKVTFPITNKVQVSGDAKTMHPFFNYLYDLRKQTSIKWNFEKFIFNKKGELVDSFGSIRSPNSTKITDLIKKLLLEK